MAKIFFSYSHDDEKYRDQLEKHLAILRDAGLIEPWHDRRILAGADFAAEIDGAMDAADVILLLISSSFMASKYCASIEMTRAMERHRRGEATVIPVIIRPCVWQLPPLGELNAVPKDGKAVTKWANDDEAYTDIAESIRAVVEARVKKASPSASLTMPSPLPVAAAPKAGGLEPLPRSSNLRLKKDFTELDKDEFLHDAFTFITKYFEGSLLELQQRNPGVEGKFRLIDANTLTAAIYRDGKKLSECAIKLGGGGFRDGGITFSDDANSRGNSFNEMLSVAADDQALFLKPMGMAMHIQRADRLSPEGGAEFYWQMLIGRLQ